MGLLKLSLILFIITFPLAEIGRVQFSNGVAISVNDILLVLVILISVFTQFSKKKYFNKGKLKFPILLFIFITFVSLIINITSLNLEKFLVSFLYLLRFGAYASLYFIVKALDARSKKVISYAMLVSGFLVVLAGYIQFFLYPSLRNLYYLGWDEHLYRMFSSFLDPNYAGAFFVLFFFYSLSFIKEFFIRKNFKKLSITVFVTISTLGAIFLTYSRSALIMFVISMVVYFILVSKKKFIFFALATVILLIILSPKSFKTEGTNFLRTASSEARLQSVGVAMNIFSKSPLFGVGFNTYRYAQNKSGLTGALWETTHSGAGTDNSFLFVLATTGVIGIISYVYLLFKILQLAKLKVKANKFASVLLPVLLGLFVNSLFINSLFYVLILEWIWILSSFTESN